jgi:hypothetical protein
VPARILKHAGSVIVVLLICSHIIGAGNRGRENALIVLKTADKKYKFLADLKTVRHFATIGLVREQLD